MMGTRADFYRRDADKLVWLGSIAWDGYPEGLHPALLRAPTDDESWQGHVADFLAGREDATIPSQGWPWPWPDSGTTDYAYVWTPDGVRASNYGSAWFDPLTEGEADGPRASFPDMTAVQAVDFGERSGLITFVASTEEEADG